MNLRTPKSGLGLRVGIVGLGLLLTALYLGCGRMPEEGFWEPTAEDSTAIDAVIQANKDLFLSGFDEGGLAHADTVMPGTTATRLRNEIDESPYKQRFRVDSIRHHFYFPNDSQDLVYTFAANTNLDTTINDTTCTATLAESIPGFLEMHVYSYTRFVKVDTFVPSPGETLLLDRYDTLFSDTSLVIQKTLWGASTNGCVLRKENGEWKLWKVAGGSRFYAPTPDDAPYLAYLYLTNGETEYELQLRPDTLQYGISRFYDLGEENTEDSVINSLPCFSVGDSIYVRSLATTVLDCANYIYFNGERHEFKASDKIALTQAGVFRLFVEQVPIEVLYEAAGKPFEQGDEIEGNYVAVAWGIAIKVIE